MELKYVNRLTVVVLLSSNCTFMELKSLTNANANAAYLF